MDVILHSMCFMKTISLKYNWMPLLKTIFVTVAALLTFPNFAMAEINVMGPLLIGDPYHPDADVSKKAWIEFEQQLRSAKANGVESVSTDIWWGLVEAQKGAYEWRYYEKMADIISRVGLRWNPILSFHQLGGNVGDSGFIPLPEWVWAQGYYQTKSADTTKLMFKSENGNLSKEYVSFWATDIMKPRYEWFMVAFQANFFKYASIINEINISMGPAGELRYPSYNMHDGPSAGYPHRGALQAYSDLAVDSFRETMKMKYQTLQNLNNSWGSQLSSFEQIYPPNQQELKNSFFETNQHFSAYGKDFFDWYSGSLSEHARKMISIAKSVFKSNEAAFVSAKIGLKIPGVHWRAGGDRLAELNAGMIKTSYGDWYSDKADFGYWDLLKSLSGISQNLVIHFTATELPDRAYEGALKVDSLAETLVRKIGVASSKYQFELKGENALSWSLYDPASFSRMSRAMTEYGYSGMTLLRIDEIYKNSAILESIKALPKGSSSRNSCQGIFR